MLTTSKALSNVSPYTLDPIHENMGVDDIEIAKEIWQMKYKLPSEEQHTDTIFRIISGVCTEEIDNDPEFKLEVAGAMKDLLILLGGRINAGAGTKNNVTLMNCYVMGSIADDMSSIFMNLGESALTMQQGGGIGMNFGTLRPSGAALYRQIGAEASGPIPFMDTWDAMCKTIMSAGTRRGAMMATINDTHPDILQFIEAKQTEGRLTQFNVSVLVSDALIDAVRYNEDWPLYFEVPPLANGNVESFVDDQGVTQYIYQTVKAREVWEKLLRNTYEYSEPGVIFIDRVNDLNNLGYCEKIDATNPCGEQPLPPYGCCLLSQLNLARVVRDPFTPKARVDTDLIKYLTRLTVRFMDNVIEATNYPLPIQQDEEHRKRRIGLGITGLADMLIQLGIRYGSSEAEVAARQVQRTIAIEAYDASSDLAKVRGPYPEFNATKFLARPFPNKLPKELRAKIRTQGIRNGVALTVAPVGTGSLYYGNTGSGLEPVFSMVQRRKILQPDGTKQEHVAYNYSYRLWCKTHGHNPDEFDISKLPNYFVTAMSGELSVQEHVRMQAAIQEWVDASVSKTINCPEDLTFEEFGDIYRSAYELGCKGCTTYRPSDIRGSVLEDATASKSKVLQRTRPSRLPGFTYKVRWPHHPAAIYVTINAYNGKPFEIFLNTKSARQGDWMTALTLALTAIFRSSDDPTFILEELQQIASPYEVGWVDGKQFFSLPALIGNIVLKHLQGEEQPDEITALASAEKQDPSVMMSFCTHCGSKSLVHEEGCARCLSCGWSNCG